jgi:hypothetical protein
LQPVIGLSFHQEVGLRQRPHQTAETVVCASGISHALALGLYNHSDQGATFAARPIIFRQHRASIPAMGKAASGDERILGPRTITVVAEVCA